MHGKMNNHTREVLTFSLPQQGSTDHCQCAETGSFSAKPAGKTSVKHSFEAASNQLSFPLKTYMLLERLFGGQEARSEPECDSDLRRPGSLTSPSRYTRRNERLHYALGQRAHGQSARGIPHSDNVAANLPRARCRRRTMNMTRGTEGWEVPI